MTKMRLLAATVAAAALLMVAGCKKKPVANLPPVPQVGEPARVSEPPRTTTPQTVAQTPAQVNNPTRPSTPDEKTRARIQDLLDRIQDAYFDYDKHDIRADAQKTLSEDAHALTDILKDYPDYKLTVEGYCDERGSDEYNLALGDARAKQAKEFLVGLGIPQAQLKTVSYGKAKPVCTDQNEGCWQKNRRAHITQEQS
jgi:peptidoglycan-associated lipoprotein